MPLPQHRIPIHLEQEDKFLLGMTSRQILVLGIGATLAYSAFPSTITAASLLVGGLIAGLIMLGAIIVAFVRVKHRDLEQWAMIALMYWAQPKTYLWHPLAEEEEEDDEREQARMRRYQQHEKEDVDEWA